MVVRAETKGRLINEHGGPEMIILQNVACAYFQLMSNPIVVPVRPNLARTP